MAAGGGRPGRDRDAAAAALAVILGEALAAARAALVSAVRQAATVAADSVSGFARVDPAVVQSPEIWQPAVAAAERFAVDAYWDAVDGELGDLADSLSVEELDEVFGDGEAEAVTAAVAAVAAWRDNAAGWAAGRVEAAVTAGTSVDDLVDGLSDDAVASGPLAEASAAGLAGVAASAVWIVAALGVARSGLATQPAGGVEGDDSGTSGTAAGVVAGKVWLTVLDERVRDTHAALEGVVVPVDADFDVGGFPAAYPRDDRLPPAESANCRCRVAAATLDGTPTDETALPADIPADVATALMEGDMFASRRPWFARGVGRFEWDESLHPRDESGRFGPGGGGDGGPSAAGATADDMARAVDATLPDSDRIEAAGRMFTGDLGGGYSSKVEDVHDEIFGQYTDEERTVTELRGHFFDQDGLYAGQFVRHFDPANGVVTHTEISVAPRARGQGFATEFNRRAEVGYAAAGYTRIRLDAGFDVGGYAWARAGFTMDNSSEQRRADNLMALTTVRDRLAGSDLADVVAVHARVSAAVDAGDPAVAPSMWEISEAGRSSATGAGPSSTYPGKSALLGTLWHGERAVRSEERIAAVDDTILERARWMFEHAQTAGRVVVFAAVGSPPVSLPLVDAHDVWVAELAAGGDQQPYDETRAAGAGSVYGVCHLDVDASPADQALLVSMIDGDGDAQSLAGRRTWRAWFEVDQLHTHGRCSRCGGWLQPDKWCPACGGDYEGPGDSRDRSGPHREPEPGVEVAEVEAAARRWRPWFARGVARFEWDESLHPRDDDGRFGPGGGGSSDSETAASPARPGLSEEQAERTRAMFERAPAPPATREDDGSGRATADAAQDVHAARAGALGLRGDTRLGREVGAIIGDHPDGPAAAREAFLRDPARVSAAGAAVRAEMAVRAGASDEWARQHEELTVTRLQADAAGRLPGFLPFEGSKVDLGGGQSTAFLVAQKDVAATLDRVGRWEQMTAGLDETARWDALHEEEDRVRDRLGGATDAEAKGLRQELAQLGDYRSGNGQAAVDAMRAVGDVGGRIVDKGVEVDGRVYGWRNLGDAQTALGARADGMARDLAATAPEGPYRAALELDGHRADYMAAVRESAKIGRELDAAFDGLGSLERGSAAEAAAYERIADLQARSDAAQVAVDRVSTTIREARNQIAAGHADRLLDVLSDIRPMGGRVDYVGEHRDATTVGRYLPAAWIDASNARGQVRFDSVPAGQNSAGYYSDREGRVVVGDGYTGSARDATVIHEFTHRAQYSSLALQQADSAYFWSRVPAREATAGLVGLLGYKVAGEAVEGYRDSWADPYMGRRYSGSTLRPFQSPSTAKQYPTSELLTKSVEMAYLGPTATGGYDAAAAAWAMGVLATV